MLPQAWAWYKRRRQSRLAAAAAAAHRASGLHVATERVYTQSTKAPPACPEEAIQGQGPTLLAQKLGPDPESDPDPDPDPDPDLGYVPTWQVAACTHDVESPNARQGHAASKPDYGGHAVFAGGDGRAAATAAAAAGPGVAVGRGGDDDATADATAEATAPASGPPLQRTAPPTPQVRPHMALLQRIKRSTILTHVAKARTRTGPGENRLDPTNQLPTTNRLDPTNQLPTTNRLGPTNQLPTTNRLEPTNQLPTTNRLDPTNQLPTSNRLDPTNQLRPNNRLDPITPLAPPLVTPAAEGGSGAVSGSAASWQQQAAVGCSVGLQGSKAPQQTLRTRPKLSVFRS